MRIGVLGGTFDPIHNGHLELAKAALKQLCLDRIIFIPACSHPFEDKRTRHISPDIRMEMTKLAIENYPAFEVSDLELKRGGISYTVDTLRELRKQYPFPHEIFFITGGDWSKELLKWKEIDQIFKLAHFVVAARPGFDATSLPPEVKFLDFVPLDISSSDIRMRIQNKLPVDSLIPQPVIQYIQQHQLYNRS